MEQFSKFLASRLARQQQTAEAHPDADALTAFAENRLKSNERKLLLAHLATCSECREVLSLISPAAAPALTTARPSFQWWNLRWAAALAAACLIAVVVLRHPAPQPPTEYSTVDTHAPVQMPPPAQPVSPIASLKRKKFISPRAVVAAKPSASPAQPVLLSPPNIANLQPPAEHFQPNTIPLSPPPPPPPAHAFASQQSLEQSAAIEMMPQRRLAKNALFAARSHSLWRIGNTPGTLLASNDGGQTWQAIPVAGQTNLLSLSVSGSDVWVGAENGALFHSTDNGAHWTPVSVPFTDSITAIHTSGSLIRLTTKPGEWLSSDDGHTWSTK